MRKRTHINNKGKVCLVCDKPAQCKYLCMVHYNEKYMKDYFDKWKKNNKKHMKEWRKNYVPSRKYSYKNFNKSIESMHKKRFGGLREKVIQRDNEKCIECGMTRQEHKDTWDRDITVDHYDGEGRNSNSPNHTMENLQTLCLRCHGKKDIQRKIQMKAR